MKAEFHFEGEPVAFAVVEKPAVQALLDGRAKIAKGWCQGSFSIDRPECFGGAAYCSLGAVGRFNKVALYLCSSLPPDSNGLVSYNDAPGRTQDDILALYDRAIFLARAA